MTAAPRGPVRFSEKPRGPRTTPGMAAKTAPATRGEDNPEKAREPVHPAVHVAQPVLTVLGRLEVAPRVGRRVGRRVRLARRTYDARLFISIALGRPLGRSLPHLPGLGLGAFRLGGRLPARALLVVLPERDPAGLLLVRIVPQRPRPAAFLRTVSGSLRHLSPFDNTLLLRRAVACPDSTPSAAGPRRRGHRPPRV